MSQPGRRQPGAAMRREHPCRARSQQASGPSRDVERHETPLQGRPPDATVIVPAPLPEGPGEIVARPDGFHWLAPDGRQEFGPFDSFEETRAFRDAYDDDALLPAATLQEAEAEIGIADWLDPDTGEPAGGGCPPRLEAD